MPPDEFKRHSCLLLQHPTRSQAAYLVIQIAAACLITQVLAVNCKPRDVRSLFKIDTVSCDNNNMVVSHFLLVYRMDGRWMDEWVDKWENDTFPVKSS